MARQCTVCSHPQRHAIETDRQNGLSYRTIADRYGLAETSIKRHCASHLGISTQSAQTPSSADRPRTYKRPSGQHIAPEVKPELQQAFLSAFIASANESGACREVHIDRSTVRNWEKTDLTFALRYQDARDQVNDTIRAEIHKRGVLGYTETLMNARGDTVDVTKYSDRLLEFWAKARMSEFRDKSQLDVTSNGHTVGQGITLDQLIAITSQATTDIAAWEQQRGFSDDDLGPH